MRRFIILLRGINVSGQKKMPMAELRELLSKKGFDNVRTYIQSGNIILDSKLDKDQVKRVIYESIIEYFGFQAKVMVKFPLEIENIFNACPFSEEKKQNSYFILLDEVPEEERISELNSLSFPGEEFIFTEECIYLFVENGFGKAKLSTNYFERKLKVAATARNFKTMTKLLSLYKE